VCFTGFRAGHWTARLVVDQSDSDLQVTVVDDENDPLTARVRQRDVAALAEYVDTHRKPLLVFIERQLGPGLRRKIEVEDILQEVSVEAVRALPETDLGERKIFSWLCQLAERRIIDAHRRFFGAQKRDAGREVPLGSPGGDSEHAAIIDLLVASMTTPTQALSRNMKEVRLLEALATLPADQREALRLRYVENLPSKDIAARLGKSDGSVRVMLTRALARLNQMLGPDAMPR
jgi:RNA polymerase sigma-70 factor (ECF subfamily)